MFAETPVVGPPPRPAELDISFDVNVGEPMMIAGQEQSAYINITLGGFALPVTTRAPINLALVLDRSASMAGDRLEKAKAAAQMVVDRLQPDDTLSVVTFDSRVEVLVPAQKVSARGAIKEQILGLTPRGSTALFAGVTFGLEEVSKFLDPKRVNRIILLSDGQANVGPASPNELGRLGEVAARQGVTITTIGLGSDYNEDLMAQLAMRSDGNHAYAQSGADLGRIFGFELGDILSVVAQDVQIEIELAPGVVPVRALGREAAIAGRKATIALSQLYAQQKKNVVLEVKVPAGVAGAKRNLADVNVSYANMVSKKKGAKRGAVGVEFSADKTLVTARQNRAALELAVEAIATDNNRQAVALRDQGKVREAQQALERNAVYLQQEAARLSSEKLKVYERQNVEESRSIDKRDWNETRKSMREDHLKRGMSRGW
ncbi:MAG: VWA domain-containing protein [Deltaproteobacteria bacterium]|nr:VWA domain-containing protein [Deltaproteobacteria bacterium]MCW5805799.1 VWA domain-containing protein [Deltaproteobacteria bacterium]